MAQIGQMDTDSERICVHWPDLRHLRSGFAEISTAPGPSAGHCNASAILFVSFRQVHH
jgi:hypothetical protein